MSENEFFEIEEKLVELIAKYEQGCIERDLNFESNLRELINRAQEDI